MTYTVCSLKIYHICNDSGGFKSLTKWGTRSFNPIDFSVAYIEGGAQGPRGPLPPPVDRQGVVQHDLHAVFFFFFFFFFVGCIEGLQLNLQLSDTSYSSPVAYEVWSL